MKSISIFIVDDHEVLRFGLREALQMEPDLDVVGESDRFQGTAARIVETMPDVAILDIRLRDGSGIELCRDILGEAPDIRCLMFTSSSGDEALYQSIVAGASGYLLKDAPRADLVHAIHTVAAGQSLIDPSMTERVLHRLRKPEEATARLTEQEAKVLALIGEGLTNRCIASRLNLAPQTVKNYVSRVLTKLDMGRTNAALYAAGFRPAPEDHDQHQRPEQDQD